MPQVPVQEDPDSWAQLVTKCPVYHLQTRSSAIEERLQNTLCS